MMFLGHRIEIRPHAMKKVESTLLALLVAAGKGGPLFMSGCLIPER